MQHGEPCDRPHADAKDQGRCEGKLGAEDEEVEDIEIRKVDGPYELAMELESGPLGHLLHPEV